jgi:hypothetical protein
MPRSVWCARCNAPWEEVDQDHHPQICPACDRQTSWFTSPKGTEPPRLARAYDLTPADRRFLRTLRIASDVTSTTP